MAAGNQTLTVHLDADVSGMLKGVEQGSKALNEIQTEIKDLSHATAEIKVEAGGPAQTQLDNIAANVDRLDRLGVDVPIHAETAEIDHDLANLNKVLTGLKQRKVDPAVGLDLVGLLRDEAKVEKAIADLEKKKASIAVEIDATTVSTGDATSVGAKIGQVTGSSAATSFGSAFAGAIAGQLSQRFPDITKKIEGKFQSIGETISTAMGNKDTALRKQGDALHYVSQAYDTLVQSRKDVQNLHPAGKFEAADVASFSEAATAITGVGTESVKASGKLGVLAASFAHAKEKMGFFRSLRFAVSDLKSIRGSMSGAAAEADDLGGSAAGAAGGLTAAGKALEGIGASGAAAAGGIALVGAAAGKMAWDFGQKAADVQTSIVQLGALVGDQKLGEKLFADLQKWAASTPFAIDDATNAAKTLIATGVGVKDVQDNLNDLGNVASATGAPLEQIATIFGQMRSKGKASFEEMQQLAEANIPVWSTLAKKMGIGVPELQQLATQGKLGAGYIDLLRESLNELYPQAMLDQSKTFNGQMSTLKDTFNQTQQMLGQLFLPYMTDLLKLFNWILTPILKATSALADFSGWLEKKTGTGLVGNIFDAVTGTKLFSRSSGDAKKSTKSLGEEGQLASDKILAGLGNVTGATQTATQKAEDLKQKYAEVKQSFSDAVAALGNIGVNIRTTVSFLISQDDLRDSINKALRGTKDEKGVELPAHLHITDIGGLSDKQQGVISDIASFASAGLQEGMRRASLPQIYPNFNFTDFYRKLRAQTRTILIRAGVDPKDADRVLNKIVGLPRVAKIEPKVVKVDEAHRKLKNFGKTITPKIKPKVDTSGVLPPTALGLKPNLFQKFGTVPITPQVQKPTTAPGAPTLKQAAAPRTAKIHAATTGTKDAKTNLDNTAMPGTKPRRATIIPHIDHDALVDVQTTMRRLTATQTKTIKIHMQENPTGQTLTPDMFRNGLVGASRTLTVAPAFGGGQRPGVQQHTQLAPRQTPVQVLLDGHVIADRLQARTDRLAASGSVRRTA